MINYIKLMRKRTINMIADLSTYLHAWFCLLNMSPRVTFTSKYEHQTQIPHTFNSFQNHMGVHWKSLNIVLLKTVVKKMAKCSMISPPNPVICGSQWPEVATWSRGSSTSRVDAIGWISVMLGRGGCTLSTKEMWSSFYHNIRAKNKWNVTHIFCVIWP